MPTDTTTPTAGYWGPGVPGYDPKNPFGGIPVYGTVGGGAVAPTPLPGQLSGVPGIFDSGGGVNLANYFKAIGQHDPYGQTGGTNATTSGTTPSTSPPSYTKPASWSDAQWQSWQNVYGGGQSSNPAAAPPTTPTTTPSSNPTTQSDPFTAWMSQQGVFPYNQFTGYNPAASGYNPGAMPNYTMDTPF